MKRKSLPVGILALALMVMLGSIGVAYGANTWSQKLEAIGTVSTATFDVHWLDATNVSPSCGPVAIQQPLDANDFRLNFDAKNVKPGYTCSFDAHIVNHGTIPVTLSVTKQQPIDAVGNPIGWLTTTMSGFTDGQTINENDGLATGTLTFTVNGTAPKTAVDPLSKDGVAIFTFVATQQ